VIGDGNFAAAGHEQLDVADVFFPGGAAHGDRVGGDRRRLPRPVLSAIFPSQAALVLGTADH